MLQKKELVNVARHHKEAPQAKNVAVLSNFLWPAVGPPFCVRSNMLIICIAVWFWRQRPPFVFDSYKENDER